VKKNEKTSAGKDAVFGERRRPQPLSEAERDNRTSTVSTASSGNQKGQPPRKVVAAIPKASSRLALGNSRPPTASAGVIKNEVVPITTEQPTEGRKRCLRHSILGFEVSEGICNLCEAYILAEGNFEEARRIFLSKK
jgi:hypothetical protein